MGNNCIYLSVIKWPKIKSANIPRGFEMNTYKWLKVSKNGFSKLIILPLGCNFIRKCYILYSMWFKLNCKNCILGLMLSGDPTTKVNFFLNMMNKTMIGLLCFVTSAGL